MALFDKVTEGLEALGQLAPKRPATPFVYSKRVEAVWPKNLPAFQVQRLLDDVKNKHLTMRDLNIAEELFRHKYLSAMQLQALFFADVKNKRLFSEKMQKLAALRIVNSVGWTMDGKLSKSKAYYLDAGGAALLELYRQRDLGRWKAQDAIRALSYVFRNLVTNDIYVKLIELTKHLGEEEGLGLFETEPTLKISDQVRHEITPTARFTFTRRHKTLEFFIEVVRGSDGDISFLPGRLRRYNDWYLTKNLKTPPALIVVCESDAQALEVDRSIAALNLKELRKWCRYTTDARLAEGLAQALFQVIANEGIKRISADIFKP